MTVEISRYGAHPDQVLALHRPAGTPVSPTVVLLHGGFWREAYGADLMDPLAADLTGRGHLAVNVEYRRTGGAGGWPTTLEDVAAAVDHLASIDDLPTERVVAVGHSAGGHLAVWLAARSRLPDGAPGGAPRVPVAAAVSLAGVLDLRYAVELDLGEGTPVLDLLGGDPVAVPDRYDLASPVDLLPLGVPVALIQGEDDDVVPPAMHERYAERARAVGDDVRAIVLPGDHFDIIDPAHPLWVAAARALAELR